MNVLRITSFLFRLGLYIDRIRLIRAVVLMLSGYLAAPLAALMLAHFVDDAIAGRLGTLWWLVIIIAVLLVAQTMLSHFAHLDYFELAEMQEAKLRVKLIDLVNRPARISHLSSAGFADDVCLVRESLVGTTRALEGILQLVGLVLQTAITSAILIAVNAWLALLPLTAIPPVLFARRAQAIYERAREDSAGQLRLSRHFIKLATTASSVKELRVFAAEQELLARQATAWREITGRMWHGQARGAGLRAAGQVLFSLGYGGAILLIIAQAMGGRATIGGLILVITLAVQVSVQFSSALQLLALLQSAGRTVQRMESLQKAAEAAPGPQPVAPQQGKARVGVPTQLHVGITLDRVSFCYPNTKQPVLCDVSLQIPAGNTLALVGENGAGKSTFVKLLCGLYHPDSGRILVDGVDLADMDPAEWRTKVTALFQDFYRFEFTLGEGIGLGDVARMDDNVALANAVERARAQSVVDAVSGGLAGFTGRSYGDGTDLSGGQWQTVGLARCLMRTGPLLLVLDEPAASLDAAAEHALFERYASTASDAARGPGGVTVLISHRFSTVRMADTIAVLEHGRLVQHGSHKDLLASGGLYAELFNIQARAYR